MIDRVTFMNSIFVVYRDISATEKEKKKPTRKGKNAEKKREERRKKQKMYPSVHWGHLEL